MTFEEVVNQVRKLPSATQQRIAEELVKLAFEAAFGTPRAHGDRTNRPAERSASKARSSSGSGQGRLAFLEWAEDMSWPATAKQVGVALPTVYAIRDDKGPPRKPVREKIERATKGLIPAGIPW